VFDSRNKEIKPVPPTLSQRTRQKWGTRPKTTNYVVLVESKARVSARRILVCFGSNFECAHPTAQPNQIADEQVSWFNLRDNLRRKPVFSETSDSTPVAHECSPSFRRKKIEVCRHAFGLKLSLREVGLNYIVKYRL
jgi:hypothetical protein